MSIWRRFRMFSGSAVRRSSCGCYQQPVQCDIGVIFAAEAWGATAAALQSTPSVMASVAIARLIMVVIP